MNQFLNRAKKNAVRNFDAKKLDKIQQNSSLNWLRDETIRDEKFSTPNKIRLPDLVMRGVPQIILEHDTVKLHSELGYENERTIRRNEDYTRAKKPFFVINQDLCKMLQLDQAKLATYLYYHTLSQINCGVWE